MGVQPILESQLSADELRVANYLLSWGAAPLDEVVKQAVRAGSPRVLNLSSSSSPLPLLYVTEDRIKHKFSSPPDVMRFSFPQKLTLITPKDPSFVRGVSIAYLRLEDCIDCYDLADDTLAFAHSRNHATATSYRVSIDNLFYSSNELERGF